MKYTEKLGYIALGGFLMLVGMLASNLTLLTAQRETFGEITCTGLKVVDSNRMPTVVLSTDLRGGSVRVSSKDAKSLVGRRSAVMSISDRGGLVSVFGKGESQANMRITRFGGLVSVWSKGNPRASVSINQHGGAVYVGSNDKLRSPGAKTSMNIRAGISVDEHGGRLDIFDKDGNWMD